MSHFLVDLMIDVFESGFGNEESKLYKDVASSSLIANYIALSCYFIGRHDEGIKYCNFGIKVLGQETDKLETLGRLHETAGLCYDRKGDADKAIEYFERAAEIVQNMPKEVENEKKTELTGHINKKLSQLKDRKAKRGSDDD